MSLGCDMVVDLLRSPQLYDIFAQQDNDERGIAVVVLMRDDGYSCDDDSLERCR